MKKISKITICLNNICDKKCDYCYRNNNDNFFKKSLDFKYWQELAKYLAFTKDIELDKEVGVCFTGGEPFLTSYNMIEGIFTLKAIEIIKNINLKFGCITNLTSPKDLLDFLDRGYLYKEGVSISWDYTGDYIENLEIKTLYEINRGYYNNKYSDLYIKMALTDKTIPYLYEGLVLLRDYGFSNIGYYFVNGTKDYEDENIIKEFKKQLSCIKKFIGLSTYVRNYNEILLYPEYPYCDKIGELLYIDTAGSIWPCSFFSDDSKVHGISNIQDYKLGDIFNGIRKGYKEIIDEPNKKPLEHFCHACSDECKEKIRKMKQIELDIFKR